MPTLSQLQAESWWNREITPAPLHELGRRLCAAYKRPLNAYGIKGDQFHLNGAHRSQEWIKNSRWCTSRTYTVQSGLTSEQARYLAGFDFNPGSTNGMIELCRRLDRAVLAGTLEDVREWFGNDDGDQRVDGYDNVRNRVASSDASHLWHLHLTLDRRKVNQAAAVRRIGDVLLGINQTGGDPMIGLSRGDRGQEVKGLQVILRAAGHSPGGVDGIYGPSTAAAVLALRKARGSEATDGDSIDGWAYGQIMTTLAEARARAVGAGVPGPVGPRGEPGPKGDPGTLHLPDRITGTVSIDVASTTTGS